ncbi:MAG: DegV family protein, partial [Ruminococcus sp.]
MKIAIMTDSNSGITQAEAKKLGIYVLPMPFEIDKKTYFEDIDLSPKEFYKKLRDGSDVCTSQPSPADVTQMWDEILEDYDSLIYIPMSSGLSNSCQTAKALAMEEEYKNKVFVSDTTRISVPQRQACLDALTLLKTCQSAKYICDYLESTGKDASIYIAVDTMKYLKKGGRVTPAAAGIATVLGIKPVLLIKGGKLDSYAKVRGMKAAQDTMIEAL